MKYSFLNILIIILFTLLSISIRIYADDTEDKCLLCPVEEKNCTIDPLGIRKAVKCDFSTQVCFTRTDELGRNDRGCIDKSECSGKCVPCNSTYCNDRITPFDRRACYNCQGVECAEPVRIKMKPEFCLYYNSSSLIDCYYTKSDFNIKRGCFIGATKEDLECQDFFKNCSKSTCTNVKWDKSRPCNLAPVSLAYKCYSCNSKDNDRCSKEFTDSLFEDCSARNGCYEKYSNGLASRGCASSLTEEELKECKDPEYKNCRYCDLPICNFQKINGARIMTYSNILLSLLILTIWKFN